MSKKKSWSEKLADSKNLPKLVVLEGEAARKWGGKKMVVPRPIDVKDLMQQVPEGRVTTINEIRKALALKYCVDTACPLTTGIFVWVTAHASNEMIQHGEAEVVPYWRTLKNQGQLNEKFPNGVENQQQRLVNEGFFIVSKGRKFFVQDFDKYLFKSSEFLFELSPL